MSFDLSNPGRKINVGIVLLGSETELLDIAPIDLLNGLTPAFLAVLPLPEKLKAQAIDMSFHWVTERGDDAKLTSGATVKATASFTTSPPLDVAILGAAAPSYTPSNGELAFLRKTYDDCSALLLVCGGFDPVLRAGLLAGKKATAPRFLVPMLREGAPETDWVERRWVRDGKVWTTGALVNGMDMIVQFVKETWAAQDGSNADRAELVEQLVEIGGWAARGDTYDN